MDEFAKFILIFLTISIFVIIAAGDEIIELLEYLIEKQEMKRRNTNITEGKINK